VKATFLHFHDPGMDYCRKRYSSAPPAIRGTGTHDAERVFNCEDQCLLQLQAEGGPLAALQTHCSDYFTPHSARATGNEAIFPWEFCDDSEPQRIAQSGVRDDMQEAGLKAMKHKKGEQEYERPDLKAADTVEVSLGRASKRKANKGAKKMSTPRTPRTPRCLPVKETTAAAQALAEAVPEEAIPAEGLIQHHKAALDEQQRLEEQRKAEAQKRDEKEREMQRQQEEENMRLEEQRLEQERLAKEEADRKAQEEAERKAQKAHERKRRQQREKKLRRERKDLPIEDFLALQEMRAELGEVEPEAEEIPNDIDEDALLDREIVRVKKEEFTTMTSPSNFAQLIYELQGLPAPTGTSTLQQQVQKAQQAKHRAALKEKLRTRRELEGMLSTGTSTGRRSRR